MIISGEAIVLRTMKYGESSLIATLYMREHGKVSVLAKGARNRGRSKVIALEPMSHVQAVVYTKPNRDLQLLTQCEAVRAMKGLTADLDAMAAGMAAVELVHLATVPGEAHPEQFDLLSDTLDTLQGATPHPENALYFFEVRFLEMLGFRPELSRCTVCSLPLEPGGEGGGVEFAVSPSGAVCSACARRGGATAEISLQALRALAGFQKTGKAALACRVVLTPEMNRDIRGILRRFLQHHVTGMKPLRSENVFSLLQ